MAVNRFVLNGMSYHGHGAINEIPGIVASKGFKKAFVASDPDLVKFGVTSKVTDLLEKNGIEYDGIVFIKDKTKLICDYLIDDNDWNFIGSNAKHGILIDAPYNENKKTEEILYTSNCESLVRYKNLHEFTKDFCQLYAY